MKMRKIFPAAAFILLTAQLFAASAEPTRKRFDYNGFYIQQPAGSKWNVIPRYNSSARARWAIIDPANLLHSRLATVTLSPPLPENIRKTASLETVKQGIENRYKENAAADSRMKDLKVSYRYITLHGVKFLEVSSSMRDTGSRYGKEMLLFARICCTITPDGRLMTIAVSERIPGDKGSVDSKAMDDFVNSVHLTNSAK